MKNKIKIILDVAKFFIFFFIFAFLFISLVQNCEDEQENKKIAFDSLKKLEETKIDSVYIIDLNKIQNIETYMISDTVLTNKLKKEYLSLDYHYSGNGKLTGDRYRIQLFSNSKLIIDSKIYINGVSTLVLIITRDFEEFNLEGYLMMNKNIEFVVREIMKNPL